MSFPPVSLFPVPPPPKALAEPLDDAKVDEDAYDDLEERRVAELEGERTAAADETVRDLEAQLEAARRDAAAVP